MNSVNASPLSPTISEDFLRKIEDIHMANSFILGVLIGVAGASLRLVCYQKLGRSFTFEMAIRPDHELITTGMFPLFMLDAGLVRVAYPN